jgi:hypothetical protein
MRDALALTEIEKQIGHIRAHLAAEAGGIRQ